jgi:D-galactarolactone cycloisomerase
VAVAGSFIAKVLTSDELLAQPIQVKDGMVDVPTGPGLGVDVVEEVLQRYRS